MSNIDSKPLENLARASLAQDREIAILRKQLSNARDELSIATTEYNDVLDVLIAADMWTGNPPYRGVSAAGQVQMILDELAKVTAELDELPAQLWQRWAPQGWCECGKPAVTEVTLNVEHGATKYKLCNDCYRAEVGHD